MALTRRDLLKGSVVAGAGTAALSGLAEARVPRPPSPRAVGMLYDATRCIGCRACVRRCLEANELPARPVAGVGMPTDLDASTKTVIRRVEADGRRGFVKQQCMHCVDPSCVSVCMMGALHKEGEGKREIAGERKGSGIVLWDKATCVGCRYCQIACPFNVPKFEWYSAYPAIVKCELCRHRAEPGREGPLGLANPACAEVCPRGAIVYGERGALLDDARGRVAAEPARYRPHVYGATDGGGTAVLYLAPPDVDFQMMGLPDLPERSSASFSEATSHAPYLDGLTPFALYAGVLAVIQWRRRKKERAGGEEEEQP